MIKKITLLVLTLIIFGTSLFAPFTAKPAHAGPWYDQGLSEWYVKVYDPENPTEIFGERYTAAQVQWVFYSIISWIFNLVGHDFISCGQTGDIGQCVSGLTQNTQSQDTVLAEQQPGIIEGILKDRPLSGITYVKNIGRKFNIIPEAQAQGYGFGAFDPVQNMWKAMRNVTYSLFVVVIVVMAFMIMFRVKISPQVVITVQSALPKIIIALILVTFSYAIAGFLVDLMYVVIGLLSVVLSQFFTDGEWLFHNESASTLFNFMTRGPVVGNTGTGIIGIIVGYIIVFIITLFTILLYEFGIVGTTIAAVVAGVFIIKALPLLVPLVVVFFMIVVWIIMQAVKIAYLLIRAFAFLLLYLIFAPIFIGLGPIVPFLGFNRWLREMISHLAVFPVVGLMFVMSGAFLFQANQIAFQGFEQVTNELAKLLGGSLFQPGGSSIVASSEFPPLMGDVYSLLLLGVSAVIFLIIPRAVDIMEAWIANRPFAYGTAAGQAISPIAGRSVGWAEGAGATALREAQLAAEIEAERQRYGGGTKKFKKVRTAIQQRHDTQEELERLRRVRQRFGV